ncbi:hypothetical protein HUW46_02087 [Amycolatopsis sp. CA-230715]|nr:hypothetical protein HUW46_02087 [Amycolatopsis sp. CA-230715]
MMYREFDNEMIGPTRHEETFVFIIAANSSLDTSAAAIPLPHTSSTP